MASDRIFTEVADPLAQPLGCPHCGSEDLRFKQVVVFNHKDPDRSMVAIDVGGVFSQPSVDEILAGEELVHKPTTQGAWLEYDCDDCSVYNMYFEVRFDDDGRTRFFWNYVLLGEESVAA
jgi:hypothetical protein